jgi:hypothetical protein
MSALAPTLQASFTDRLIGHRNASPQTIAESRCVRHGADPRERWFSTNAALIGAPAKRE